MEETFLAIKPEGVQRGLCGEIIKRFESRGYKLVGCKFMVASRALLEEHYAEHSARPFFEGLVTHMSSGPLLAMVWEGKDIIVASRTMIGATNPAAAAPGTIRGDLCLDTGRNLIHGSDSPETAAREINLWFTPKEKNTFESCMHKMLYE